MKTLNEILEKAKSIKGKKICVAAAHDKDVLKSVVEAKRIGLADSILVGDEEKIKEILKEMGVNSEDFEIIDEKVSKIAAKKAVELVKNRKADALMKGYVETADLMKAILNKETGLRTDEALSHVSVFQVPGHDKLIIITDAALNISPDLSRKASIINNAVFVANRIGIEKPKVAVLAAIEFVNPDMPVTIDAAALSKMCDRGQIKNCIVDGPVAFDNAISAISAKKKGIHSPVAGDADIFLVPDIEAGNIMLKSIVFLAKGVFGGVVMGATKPLIVTSRSDSYETKLYSMATAIALLED